MIDKRVFFLHIPKTAGSSVTAAVKTHFGFKEICPYFHEAHLNGVDRSGLAQWNFFWGHLPLSIQTHLDRPFVFTFVRNPIERLLSEYHYVTTQWTEIEEQNCTTWASHLDLYRNAELLEILHNDPRFIRPRLNLQTLWLSGFEDKYPEDEEPMRQAAIANMKRMSFVGLVERMEISLILLSYKLEIPLLRLSKLLKVNSNRPQGGWRTQLKEVENQLVKMSSCDFSIYRLAEKRLEHDWCSFCGKIKIDSKRALGDEEYIKINACLNERLARSQKLSLETLPLRRLWRRLRDNLS